ncbi:MAG: hypothetical protein K2K24_02955, partial [Clostridia bacterium]|nr:hypothetical protein [Clostridia bacterium]
LGTEQYNEQYQNPNYAFWSTSKIRAMLNGGKYYYGSSAKADPDSTKDVDSNSVYYNKLFVTNEKSSIVKSTTYDTKNYGFDTSHSSPKFYTTGIIGTGNGMYIETNIDTMKTRATNCSGKISITGSGTNRGVKEETSDYLFLLDYYDINNPDFGMGDDGTTYASKVASSASISWSLNSNGYPSYYDANSVTSEYLLGTNYWLRPAGRSTTASALFVYLSGFVTYGNVGNELGVRPAFNFKSENVVYATASSNGRNNTFAAVNSYTDSKPAYKVYMKTDSYTTYSDVKITVKDDKLSVEKSSASGSAIILLADKSGSGKVEYQATANFNGSGVATATLPTNVNPRDYSITVLFTDGTARGVNYSESIKGSYTVSGHTIVPQESSVTTKYKYISDGDVSFDLENVYDKNIVDNSAWVDITIEGKNYKGETITVADSKCSIDANHKLTFNVSEAGDYTIKIKPKTGQSWADGTIAEKTYKYTLKYKLKALAWDKNNSTSITETYNGGDQYLLLKNYDEDIAKLVTLSPTYFKIPDGQTNAGKLSIKVKDYANEEKVTVSLNAAYKDYLVWDETDYPTASKELKYTVNKKELDVTSIDSDWEMIVNTTGGKTFDLWIGGVCKEED